MVEQAAIMVELLEECPTGRRGGLERKSYCWKWPVYVTLSSIDIQRTKRRTDLLRGRLFPE